MSTRTETITGLIEQCSIEEKREVIAYLRRQFPVHVLEAEWNTSAEAILTAIARSTDLTQRGIRGILAEATFEEFVIPVVQAFGWRSQSISGDRSYDFLLKRDDWNARIQVKLQRKESGRPKLYAKTARSRLAAWKSEIPLYAVEVQKTRSGLKNGKKTRPYQFGDFDILAVNMHPATGDWQRFMYTVATWLIPRAAAPELIDIYQPVPATRDEFWSDNIVECLEWLVEGRERTIYL